MRKTLNLDDTLVVEAIALSGISDIDRLLDTALRSLIAREAGRRLAKLGGSAPTAAAGRRRRSRSASRRIKRGSR